MPGRLKTFFRDHGWKLGALAALAVIVGTGAVVFGDLDAETLVRRYAELSQRVEENPFAAFVIATGVYSALVVLLLPGVPLFSIPMGLIMGWGLAILSTALGTAIGITILYGLTVWILPERLGEGRTSAIDKLGRRLREDAVGYMLFLRLMPPVPFTLLNIALPALRVPYVQFLLTSVGGMLPRLAAYCFAGEGLRGVIDGRIRRCAVQIPQCEPDFTLADFVTTEIVVATVLLGVVSLAPVVLKRIFAAKSADDPR